MITRRKFLKWMGIGTVSSIFSFEAATALIKQYNKNKQIKAVPIDVIRFEGKNILFDDFCPPGYIFALNTKYIRLVSI